MTIKKGEKIAFVGESGSGKSTLIKILLGLLKYNQGKVCLGDMELSEICLSNLYDRVSYLSQDAPVFESSKRVKAMPESGDRPRMQADFVFSNLCMGDFRSRFFSA